MVNNEITVKVKELGITYAATENDNAVLEARFIALYAPTVRSLKYVAPIKQIFMRSLMSLNELDLEKHTDKNLSKPAGTKEEPSGNDMLSVIAMSKEVKYEDLLTNFMELLQEPMLARIDGKTPITESFIDKLPLSTLEELAGEYIANFINTSALM